MVNLISFDRDKPGTGLPAELESRLQEAFAVTGGGEGASPLSTHEFFEAPSQPSFNAFDADAIWDGEGRGINEFMAEKFEPLMAEHPDLVTRTVLGKDASGTYDIVEYDIHPVGATQTILLQSGTHGRETVPVYSMYRFMHYLLNEPDIHPDIRYLRDTVRIKVIPAVGIWAGSQKPVKSYGNANGLNIVRQWPINREYISLSDRGEAALSDPDAQIIDQWHRDNLNASFGIDFHTDWSHHGGAPTKDLWVFRSDFDGVTAQALDPIVYRLGSWVREKHGWEPVIAIEDGNERTSMGKYAAEILGIPFMTMEFCETRYGQPFGGSEDVKHYLTYMVNYVAGLARQNLRKKMDESKKVDRNRVRDLRIPFNFFSDKVNLNWSIEEVYSRMDELVAENPDYATVTDLGEDQSGTYQLRSLTLTPPYYRNTIALIGGLESANGVDTAMLMHLAYLMCEDWRGTGLEELRRETRFVIIPTMNPWGFTKNAVDLNATRMGATLGDATVLKSDTNSTGSYVSRSLSTSTQAESVIIHDLLVANADTWDAVIGLRDTVSETNTQTVRYADGADSALGKIALRKAHVVNDVLPPRLEPMVRENWFGLNSGFTDFVAQAGYAHSVALMLTSWGYKKEPWEQRAGDRRTALAHMTLLLDLLDEAREVIS